ncbi:MAG: Oligopeptidase A [uncultured Gemmatimonadetes bacterium]|uniref:oligopeptidase A n=1 Tax=uncultured Gemmatimonadota bacterium TaxID=203437 RepID=A0A6J4MNT8_9BACT|nr:MAG: Oligopeptidase A [uncultured Gemmatimonadota bacterium]
MSNTPETNPLLREDPLPIPFHHIRAEHVVPGIRAALARAETELAALVADTAERSYENTVGRLEEITDRLARAIRPVGVLVAVMNSPELREAYETVLPEFSAFFARIALNGELWRAVRAAAESPGVASLDRVRRRHLEKTVRAFIRAGADLQPEEKERVEALQVELSQLQTEFSNHVLDSTNAWELVLADEAELAGLPESARAQARAAAEEKGVEGWRFTLHQPSVTAFLQYSERRDLRERIHRAYVNRASEPPHDNRPLVGRILALRRELARLLGFRDWADYELQEAMAGSGGRAVEFEEDLTRRTRPYWEREMEALQAFARDELGLDPLQPWDMAFAIEQMRRSRFGLDAEEVRPYFPMDRVQDGFFEVARRLFGVEVRERKVENVWHPEVRFYDAFDEGGRRLGGFYTDWFPRESKRGGAWMSGVVLGGPAQDGGWDEHLATIVGNMSPPEGERPALLTHREVETVFHEMGHLLHHMLSRVEVRELGGTSVPTDWVELPSQIMESWTWERPALDLFARHWQTGEPIPEELFRKMKAARTFMAAHHQMRQLAFGTLDLELHVLFDPESGEDPVARSREVMSRFHVRPDFARDHFVTGFTHIFAGGYAAGYYSYLWSEVLVADAFSRFEREGLFSREVGSAFVDAVLSRGDDTDPAELFREFMGRDPDPDALLRRNLGAE